MTPLVNGEPDAPALIEAGTGAVLTYADLDRELTRVGEALGQPRSLVFHFAATRVASVVTLLGALAAGHAVALLDPALRPELAERLIARYEPTHVTGEPPLVPSSHIPAGPGHWVRTDGVGAALHPDLAVLLSTSGTTGSPKFVRLSARGVAHNARAIAASLRLDASERAFATLPLHYSYGMSVLTSHLSAGASVVVSDASVVEPRFWQELAEHRATSLSGVPFTYAMLDRLGFLDRELPDLRTVTQAGGRLPDRLLRRFAEALPSRGVDLHVMYGQTEAGPRMSSLSVAEHGDRLGSVGRPLTDGTFTVESGDGVPLPAGTEGEVVYRGPNVMLGYATGRADLALGDVTGGVLRTGDLGYLDADGFLYLTGRSKRIGKVFGVRVSLDEVEDLVGGIGSVAVVGDEDRLLVYHDGGDEESAPAARRKLAQDLRVPVQALVFRHVDALPLLPSGKTDYRRLTASTAGSREGGTWTSTS